MAVLFSGAIGENINWGALSVLQTVQSKTIICTVNLTGVTGEIFGLSPSGASDEEWGVALPAAGGGQNRLFWYADWSSVQGQWYSTNVISTGARHLAVTYNYGSASNDPVLYVDGVSVAVTESSAPSGAYRTGSGNSVKLGGFLGPSVNGSIYRILVYNRILSASEILEDYNSRLAIPNYRGLVFAPNLVGAKGIQTFDGATLSSSNTMIDNISGAVGTPSGDPLGAADTYLTYEG